MIDFRPLTPDRWQDLERLFGPERGAVAGCWCTWFRLRRPEWDAAGRAGRKAMFQELVSRGPPPGVLAYADDAPVDDRPAFAITCFYLAPRWRRRGLMRPLIGAALDLARGQGAQLVEAYPLHPPAGARPSGAFTGVACAFRD